MAQWPKHGATVFPLRGTAIFTFSLPASASEQPNHPHRMYVQGTGQLCGGGENLANVLWQKELAGQAESTTDSGYCGAETTLLFQCFTCATSRIGHFTGS